MSRDERDNEENNEGPSGTPVETKTVVNGIGNCLATYPNKPTRNAERVDLCELNHKDKCQTIVVHSEKSGRTKMELHNSTSTQSLGVNSTAGQSIVFSKSNKRLLICFALACFLLIVACVILSVLYVEQVKKPKKLDDQNTSNSSGTSSQDVCFSPDCLEIAAEFTRNINRSVDPCNDYYSYACGGWMHYNPIPPSENEYATHVKAAKLTSVKLRDLLDEATNLKPGPLKKARDYYTACMDEREADRTATDQIWRLLREFGSWALDNSSTWNETKWEWKESLLKIQKVFSVKKSPLFGFEVVEDPTNSSRYLLKVFVYTVVFVYFVSHCYCISQQ